ncbi:MAG TPA: DNA replication protein DnaD [Ruminiclostridium sp.]|nr:DNA replication protein DnaD [Ruminiclostridium sp.]
MQFEVVKDILLSDTLVPDIFLSDVMPRLPSDAVKVYLYCVFLSKYKKEARPEDMAAKLGMSFDTVKAAFVILEQEQLIIRTPHIVSVTDVKELELNKLYKRRTTSEPEQVLAQSAGNIKRNQCIDSINKIFFQGLMAPSWYTAIDSWFEAYRFDEDVMVSLFKYCYDNNALNVKYIEKVGATWSQKGVNNHWELEKYMEACEKIRNIGNKISRALRLSRKLTSYEEKYLEVWLNEYGYDMSVIDAALERTAGKANPNFKYIHSILTAWYKEGIKTTEQVKAYQEAAPSRNIKNTDKSKVARRDNFEQRQYDDNFYDKLNESTIVRKERI